MANIDYILFFPTLIEKTKQIFSPEFNINCKEEYPLRQVLTAKYKEYYVEIEIAINEYSPKRIESNAEIKKSSYNISLGTVHYTLFPGEDNLTQYLTCFKTKIIDFIEDLKKPYTTQTFTTSGPIHIKSWDSFKSTVITPNFPIQGTIVFDTTEIQENIEKKCVEEIVKILEKE